MVAASDKKLFSIKELIQYIAYASVIIGFGYQSNLRIDRLEAKIDELKIYKTADDKVWEIRVASLERSKIETDKTLISMINKVNRLAVLAKEPELTEYGN